MTSHIYYDGLQRDCERHALAFERAAETARQRGDLNLAGVLSSYAIKLQYVAAEEPIIAEAFDDASSPCSEFEIHPQHSEIIRRCTLWKGHTEPHAYRVWAW